MMPRIGVLALQGDFQAHAAMLAGLGAETREVRREAHLEGLQGIVLPGGESTTMWTFLEALDLGPALCRFAASGGALYGTCAGVILLANEILNPERRGLGLLDITVERNGYGRQTDSSIHRVPLEESAGTSGAGPMSSTEATPYVEIVLIRAPRIVAKGSAVQCHLNWQGSPLWVEQGRIMGTTFHPELGTDDRFHKRFLELASAAPTS